jgi:hypothetical protein
VRWKLGLCRFEFFVIFLKFSFLAKYRVCLWSSRRASVTWKYKVCLSSMRRVNVRRIRHVESIGYVHVAWNGQV